MNMRRTELKFQTHIMDSYYYQGGRARKWASEWQKGMPDLICSLPEFGCHLMEVKHVPEFGPLKPTLKNPLEPKQIDEAKKYQKAGALVVVGVVMGGSQAIGTRLGLYPPDQPEFFYSEEGTVPYKPGAGYNIRKLLSVAWRNCNDEH